MSGLGPAACWMAHKGFQSWSKLAKEHVRKKGKNDDEKSTESAENSCDSLTASREVN